jgi:small redox-active disulfide protein 2
MSLFGLGKNKDQKKDTTSSSCCGEVCSPEAVEKAADNLDKGEAVKVLGSGCAKCNELEANVKNALKQLGMDTTIEHVTDFGVIAAYGVMTTPALVVDGKVVSYGKVLKVEDAVKLLQKVRS